MDCFNNIYFIFYLNDETSKYSNNINTLDFFDKVEYR